MLATNMKWDIYIATSLKQSNSTVRNTVVTKVIERLSLEFYLPKIDNSATDLEIFSRNIKALELSRNVIFIPDQAGDGVFFEVGMAHALNKPIYGYSQLNEISQGRMAKGLWDFIPDDMKSKSEIELYNKLKNSIRRNNV
ncbi:MAG: nucleoside 2-deoxyribosyltransferase [Bacteroidota bacterium]